MYTPISQIDSDSSTLSSIPSSATQSSHLNGPSTECTVSIQTTATPLITFSNPPTTFSMQTRNGITLVTPLITSNNSPTTFEVQTHNGITTMTRNELENTMTQERSFVYAGTTRSWIAVCCVVQVLFIVGIFIALKKYE